MNYFSKESYRKRTLRKGIIWGIIIAIILSLASVVIIMMLENPLDEAFQIGIPVGLFIGVIVVGYNHGQKKSADLVAVITKQERLLGAKFDQDMIRYQVPQSAKNHTCPTWFMDLTTPSELNGVWAYHIDFVRRVETEEGETTITFITGEREEIAESKALALKNWFEMNRINKNTRTFQRTFERPYAPFEIDGNTLIYEIAGFKEDVFAQVIDEDIPMEGCWFDWELLIEHYLEHKVPHLDDVMDLDSDMDGSIIRVIAPDALTLEEFAKGFRDLCDDDSRMKTYLEEAVANQENEVI